MICLASTTEAIQTPARFPCLFSTTFKTDINYFLKFLWLFTQLIQELWSFVHYSKQLEYDYIVEAYNQDFFFWGGGSSVTKNISLFATPLLYNFFAAHGTL